MRVERRVHVIGNLCRDTTLNVARFPVPGETLVAEAGEVGLGGKALNQAVAAARAGALVTLHAAVARGEAAALTAALDGHDGLVPRLVEVDRPTDSSVILVRGDGENVIVSATGCARAFDPLPALDGLLPGDVVVMQGNLGLAATKAVLGRARRAGAVTVLNPSPLWAEGTAHWPDIDLVVVNGGELGHLAGDPDPATGAAVLLSRGVGSVVATLGSRGAIYRAGADGLEIAAPAVAARDTSGAGDTFCGVLVGLMACGSEPGEALARAVAAATLSVTRPGALASCPTAAEIAALVVSTPVRSPA